MARKQFRTFSSLPFSVHFLLLLIGFSLGCGYYSIFYRVQPQCANLLQQITGASADIAGPAAAAAPAVAAASTPTLTSDTSDRVLEEPDVGAGKAVAVERPPAAAVRPVAAATEATTTAGVTGDAKPVFKGPIGPDPALGRVLATTGPNKGRPCVDCIGIALTTCCKSWDRTAVILDQLLRSNDNMHIIVFDDMTEDDSKQRVEAMGLTVLQPPSLKNVGLTEIMNLAWRYFYARPELASLFIVNNDIQISPDRTFEKLHNCLMRIEGPGVVSAMTNARGLGTGTHMSAYMSWQNAEHSRHRPLYQDVPIPREITANLPESVVAYNKWLEDSLDYLDGNVTVRVKTLLGFAMGFKHDQPLHDPAANRFIHAGRNAHQEYNMFQMRNVPAYVCQDTFIYHDKLAAASPHIRAAMEKNMLQVNKKGQQPGHQS